MEFLYFLVGFIILLLFILIGRVSALTKMVRGLKKTIKDVEANITGRCPAQGVPSSSAAVPGAVIAAISAAVSEYRAAQ